MSRPDCASARPLAAGIMDGLGLPPEEATQLEDFIRGLTLFEARFVLEYMMDLNPNKAMTRMGHGVSIVGGPIILNRPHVRRAVDALLEIRARNQALVVNRLLVELDELAHFDKGDLFDDDGTIRPMSEWPPAARQALTGFDVEELWMGRGKDRVQVGVVKRARFIDPLRARELLGRHLRLWGEPQVNVNKTTNVSAQVNVNAKLDLSDFTIEELGVLLRLGLRLQAEGQVVELLPPGELERIVDGCE